MELRGRPAVATLLAAEPFESGRSVLLGESEARHLQVRRVEVGSRVCVVDGAGARAEGTLVRLAKTQATVALETVEQIAPLPDVHLLVPIADRDRMLWLAEKATEFGVTSWRPVAWRRSRSVSPRGEGVTFRQKTRARMISALTQSGGAWLPILYPDATPERAIAACPAGTRWMLDCGGDRVAMQPIAAPATIAVGPEGGFEEDERAALLDAGFVAVHLAPLTLRFETAAIAGVAMARAALSAFVEHDHD